MAANGGTPSVQQRTSGTSSASSHLSSIQKQVQHPALSIHSSAFAYKQLKVSSSSTLAVSTSSTVRRKPLPLTASHLATRYSSSEHLQTKLEQAPKEFSRPFSLDSPVVYASPDSVVRDLERYVPA